tara:strand:- start:624 stop:770 length:147 start_codon:yes stop_codon:yes gene_type:complete
MTIIEQINSLRSQILDLKVKAQTMNTKSTIQKLQQELDDLIQQKDNGI